jgi:hypothetical protein
VLAEKLLREGGPTPAAKIAWALARAVARPPTPDETAVLLDLLGQQRARYAADEAAARALVATGDWPVANDLPPVELAAWTAVTRTILNLHETITRL